MHSCVDHVEPSSAMRAMHTPAKTSISDLSYPVERDSHAGKIHAGSMHALPQAPADKQ